MMQERRAGVCVAMAVEVNDNGRKKDTGKVKPSSGFWGEHSSWKGGSEQEGGGGWAHFETESGGTGGGQWANFESVPARAGQPNGECWSSEADTVQWATFEDARARHGDADRDGRGRDDSDWQDFTHSGSVTSSLALCTYSRSISMDSVFIDEKPRSFSLPIGQSDQRVPQSGGSGALCELSRAVFRDCFCTHTPDLKDESIGPLQRVESLMDQRFWSHLGNRACSPKHLGTHRAIEDKLCGVLFPAEMCSLQSIHPELGRDCEGFEWSLEPERRGSISPDLLPSFFRSKAESPVGLEFDHDRAAMGLALLGMEELQIMCEEMTSKFTRLSDILVSELQERDVVVHKMEAKNRFISALLKVQNLRHNLGLNGSVNGTARSRARTWTGKGREERNSGKFLQTAIPYTAPEDLHWKISMLQQLTKILQGIAEDSDSVPGLMSEYLKSEVLASPVEHKSFDSLERDFSSLSV